MDIVQGKATLPGGRVVATIRGASRRARE